MAKLQIILEKERITKNTIRYAELEDEQPPIVRSLYIQKFGVKKLGDPQKIKVTIEPA